AQAPRLAVAVGGAGVHQLRRRHRSAMRALVFRDAGLAHRAEAVDAEILPAARAAAALARGTAPPPVRAPGAAAVDAGVAVQAFAVGVARLAFGVEVEEQRARENEARGGRDGDELERAHEAPPQRAPCPGARKAK